jgi:hypothetical protein
MLVTEATRFELWRRRTFRGRLWVELQWWFTLWRLRRTIRKMYELFR